MNDVLIEQIGWTALISLNRPQSLNALTTGMFESMRRALTDWARDPEIRAVVIRGMGEKSFCAGGDVKSVARDPDALDTVTLATRFFVNEYWVDHAIHTYAKPVIVMGHGMVMGGGVGLMAGAKVRILTESTQIAMPEISIGLYPDVGGTYLLPRLPGMLGYFLGLTGSRINAIDALEFGWGDAVISSSRREALIEALVAREWSTDPKAALHQIKQLVQVFAGTLPEDLLPRAQLRPRFATIEKICAELSPITRPTPRGVVASQSIDLIESIVKALIPLRDRFEKIVADGPQYSDLWIQSAAKTFLAGCPLSAVLMIEAMRRGAAMNLQDCFKQELVMSVQSCLHPNFKEGVRARLVEKDQRPRWSPARLEEITASQIAEYFSPPWDKSPADFI